MGGRREMLLELARAVEPGQVLTVPAGWLVEVLTESEVVAMTAPVPDLVEGLGWRARLWTCPPDTRLGVRDVAEALGRSRSFVYRAVERRDGTRLPMRRFSGELVVTAAEVREWVGGQERPS